MASQNAQPISPVEVSDWNEKLGNDSGVNFFHSTEWARVMKQTYGFTPVYFVDKEKGLLPVMEVNSWLTGRRGISLPFTDDCEPLGNSESLTNLFQQALHFGRSRGWKYFESRSSRAAHGLPQNAKPSLEFFTHELPLNSNPEELFRNFDTSNRGAIRKAESSGLEVEISTSPAAMRNFYVLHCQTRKEHGIPPQPFRFFENIQREILSKNLGVIVSAKQKGRSIASAIFFSFRGQAIYKFSASDKASLQLRGNNLVMWEAIKWCIGQGNRILHFGRTSLNNEGLRRFKLRWGSIENRIHYFKYDLRMNAFLEEKDQSSGWHSRVFGSMPVFMSRLCGKVLYRHIA